MPEKVYKKVEIVGSSPRSVSDAIENASRKASETIRNMDWFEVGEIRGFFMNDQPVYQVTLKVGFRLDE